MKLKKTLIRFAAAAAISAAVLTSPLGNAIISSEAITSEAAKKPAISKKKVTLTEGKSVKLIVKNGKVKKWKTSRKSVATVSKSGKVIAKKKGTTTITAILRNGKKLTCKVTVKTKPNDGNNDVKNPVKPVPVPEIPDTSEVPKPPVTPERPDISETPEKEKTFVTVEILSDKSLVLPNDVKYMKKDNFTLSKLYSDGSKDPISDDEYYFEFMINDSNTAAKFYFTIYNLGEYTIEIPFDLSNDSIYLLDIWWKKSGETVDENYTFPKEDFTFEWVYESNKRQALTEEEYNSIELVSAKPVVYEEEGYTAYNVTFKIGDFEGYVDVGFRDY